MSSAHNVDRNSHQQASPDLPRPLTILLDTNVWLGAYIAGRPDSAAARHLLDVAYQSGTNLAYATESIRDVFFHVGATFKRAAREEHGRVTEEEARAINKVAWACARNMQEIATAIPADVSDVWLALHYESIHSDLEDDLVLTAVRRAKADYLVTSDATLLTHSPVPTLTPNDMATLLEQRLA